VSRTCKKMEKKKKSLVKTFSSEEYNSRTQLYS